jgi:3-oxoacyl-(acyl-carrier-protein) synthase
MLTERSGTARAAPSQAAAFVVLEAAGRAQAALGELLGSGGASEPQRVSVPWSSDLEGRCFVQAMREAISDAGLDPGDISTVALAAGDDASEACELVALRGVFGARRHSLQLLRPKRQLGEALGAGAGLSLLATLAWLEAGGGPSVALVNSFEMGGAASSLAVRA